MSVSLLTVVWCVVELGSGNIGAMTSTLDGHSVMISSAERNVVDDVGEDED